MNPGKRGSSERGSGQKGSDSRRSPAMHERTSGKRSPASSHSPANKCGSIPPLLQNEMNRAAAASFLGNFAGAAAFNPAVWQDLPYLLNLNPLQPSFIPRLPLGLDMFSAPFLHPMPGSAPGLFPPGLPLLRPPGSTAGLLHSPYSTLFPNVNDVPLHMLPKADQTGSRPMSAKKTSSLASSSSESDIATRTGSSNLSTKHDPKPLHSRKEYWHGPAEIAKVDMRKRLSGSPIVVKSKAEDVIDVLNYSDCTRDSPLELTVKKSSVVPVTEVGPPKRSGSAVDEVTSHDEMISRASVELHRVTPCEKYPPVPKEDDAECLSLRKTMSDVSLSLPDQPTMFSTHSGRTGNFSDGVLEELKDKADDDRRLLLETMNEARDLTKASCGPGTDFELSQISGAAPARQNIALPPRKRLTRNPEELGLGVPNQSSGSDSPSSASNFRLYWKKFAAKTNLNGQPSHRAFISGGKPVHDCRTYFQKMAAKDACKSGLLIGKTFIAGKGKGFFHRAVSRSSPRFSRTEGGIGVPPDGSTSPRVTRSQSKLKQKKSGGSPKSSPTEPPMPVRKSLRKKTANSKYETEDMITLGVKGSTKKETPPKAGTKPLGKNAEKELGKSIKSGELSDNMDDEDLKRQAKPYSLREREEKAKGRGSKGTGKEGVQKPGDASSGLPQSMQPILGGISKALEGSLETPERKKGMDDSFEEKGMGSSSKHTEHDGKSISSGISTCSADVAFDPEILSLPPKFRRSKGKTVSTSQSVSSIEDDRCAESVHKDIKVDLCRVFLDQDHSLYSGCGKIQCIVDPAMKHSETSVEGSCEELWLEPGSSKGHLDVAETAEHEELGQTGSLKEQKSSHKMPNLVEAEKKAESDKKLEVENTMEMEKKSEVEKVPEPKVDKPCRSTGGKKSLLYRSSLSATFDESSETTVVSKPEATVAPPIITHQEVVSLSAEKIPCRGKPDEPTTEIDKLKESDKTSRLQVTPITKESDKTSRSQVTPVTKESDKTSRSQLTPFTKESDKTSRSQVTPVTKESDKTSRSQVTPVTKESDKTSRSQVTPVTKESDKTSRSQVTPVAKESDKTSRSQVTPVTKESDKTSRSQVTPVTKESDKTSRSQVTPVTKESDKTSRSPVTPVTNESDKTAHEESKGVNREDIGDGTKLDFVEAPQTKSILGFPGLHGSLHLTAMVGPFFHGPVSQTDPAKCSTAMDDLDASVTSKRQGTPVTRLGTELKTCDVIHEASHEDIPVLGVTADVKQKPHVPQPTQVIASDAKVCVSDQVLACSDIASSNPVQLSTVLPILVKSSDDNSATFSLSLGEVSVKKDEFLGGIHQRGTTERRLTSDAQRASKKRSLEDTLSIVRNKKLKKGENLGLDQPGKVIVDESHQQMSAPVYDVVDDQAKDPDGGVAAAGKSSSINPLHFYSHRKSLPPSSSAALAQTVPSITTSSHSDARHSEVTPTGNRKARGPPGDVSTPKHSRSGGRRPDASSDLLSSVVDSEPPVLEKTDFTYMEQFSDISDSDEGEHRGPPMLEATSDCGVAKAKPCSGLALDKHILFAKIASSALEKGDTLSGSRPRELGTCDVEKDMVSNCDAVGNLIGNASHHPVSHSSTSPPVSYSPATSSVSRPSVPPPVSHSVLPSASSSLSHSSSPCHIYQSSAPSSASRQRKSAARQNKSTSKQGKQQSSSLGKECPTSSPSPAEFSSKDLPICREGHRYSNSTLSADDLESCGIVAPLPSVTKETVAKKKMLSKNRDATRPAASVVKNTNDLSSLLQHCKSFSVVVQKIDEKGRKRQRRSNAALDPDLDEEGLELDMAAARETIDAKQRTSSEDRKEVTHERTKEVTNEQTVTGHLSAATNRTSAVGRTTKVIGEKTTSRKQKPGVRKEVGKVTGTKDKSGTKIQSRTEKDEVKMETKDEGLNLSIYDFDKDSNDEVDFETPLSSSRKGQSKKPRTLKAATKPRRPIRLKLHVAERSPVPATTAKGRLLGDEKPESKRSKDVQPSTPHSEKSLDSNEKLAVGPTDASIGHVKCRLVKVGRHQWMSVGDSNKQESSSRGGASDARSTSSTRDGLDIDDSLPETKISRVTGKVSLKQSQSNNAGAMTVKASKARAKNHDEPKKKRGRRATRAQAVAEEFSDNSIPSFSRAESSGALSPSSVMDQASRCSESESLVVSLAGRSANSNNSKIPDFLDLLFGDDLEGFVMNEVQEPKVLDADAILRCAVERANFSNIYDSELDDYRATLSPASTFFVPSEIETQLAKMTLSDHPHDFLCDPSSELLSLSKQHVAPLQPEVRGTLPVLPTSMNLTGDDFTPQDNKENHLEVDRLLTQTLPNMADDGEDSLKNQFGDDLMEEFVSWLSPKWDDTSLQDLDDPLNSLNLFSPFTDSPKTRQKLYV